MRRFLPAFLALASSLLIASRAESQRFDNPNAAGRKAGSPCNGFGFNGIFQSPGSPPMYLPTITQVTAGGPGEAAGLMPGDTVVSIDKRDPLVDFRGFFAFTDTLTAHAFVVRRPGQTLQLSFVAGKLADDPPTGGLPQQPRRCLATKVVRDSSIKRPPGAAEESR